MSLSSDGPNVVGQGYERIAPPQGGWMPADSVRVAWADARLLEPEVACYTRYLDLHPIPPEDRVKAVLALSGHFNRISDRTMNIKPVPVGKVLLRVNLSEYASERRLKAFLATYERLADVDPYYHVRTYKTVPWPGGIWPKDGRHYARGAFKWNRPTNYPAPELVAGGQRIYDELADATHSAAPLLPADWFLNRTALQVERDGTGYYDFLGVRTLDDLEDLSGVPKRSRRREVLESVAESKVTNKGVLREIERKAGEDGGTWRTYDFRLFKALQEAAKVADPRRVPGGRVQPQAEAIEYIGRLPNGADLMAAVNAKDGKLQATVPDFIAQNHGARDMRIGPNASCLACHGPHDGLMPLDDWYRNLARPPLELGVTDLRERVRYNEQYGRALDTMLRRDRQGFNDWSLEATGVPFKEFAAAYVGEVDRYEHASVDAAWAARHLGVTQQEYQDALARGLKMRRLDLLLGGHALSAKGRARSFDIRTWEVLYPLARAALRGEYPQADYRKLKLGGR